MLKTIWIILYRIPIFGWFIRDAFEGAPDAIYFFYANVVMLAILGNYLFGLMSLIVVGPLVGVIALSALTGADHPQRRS